MNLIYQTGLFLYWVLIKIASITNTKAAQFINGRRKWKQNLPTIKPEEKWIWFQASSQGEFEDGVALIKTIRKHYPEYKILLTFFSPSGYENKRNHKFVDHTMYLPLDYKSNASYFLNYFNFKAIFFVRHDIWLNYLIEASRLKIPSFLVFCSLTKSSSTLSFPTRIVFKKAFNLFSHIFCHDGESQRILKEYFKVKNSSIAGSTRVENIVSKQVKDDIIIENFTKNSTSIIIGSSAMKDEQMLLTIIENFKSKNIKWVIVPHEIDRKFHHFKNACLYTDKEHHSNILIVNTIGILSSIYKYCDIAIVGGGFSKMGIHNIIEPAIFGIPVLFGPNDRDYPEAKALLEEGQAFKFNDSQELEELLHSLLKREEKVYLSNYIKSNVNCSEQI